MATSNKKKHKFSKTQQEAIDLLAAGWQLGYSKNMDKGRCWLQKNGVGRGGETTRITVSTFRALLDLGVLETVEDTWRLAKYSLNAAKLSELTGEVETMIKQEDEIARIRELAAQAGFVHKEYPGQPGVFLTKKLKVLDMPYMREQADNECFGLKDDAIVEITPDNGVQMTIGRDYAEEPVLIVSDEGKGLLRDAGVKLSV